MKDPNIISIQERMNKGFDLWFAKLIKESFDRTANTFLNKESTTMQPIAKCLYEQNKAQN